LSLLLCRLALIGRGRTAQLLLTQDYAVFDNPIMPIIGPSETANDAYVDPLVSSAEAAIDKAVEMGIADRDRQDPPGSFANHRGSCTLWSFALPKRRHCGI
jgi:hypothetical protein